MKPLPSSSMSSNRTKAWFLSEGVKKTSVGANVGTVGMAPGPFRSCVALRCRLSTKPETAAWPLAVAMVSIQAIQSSSETWDRQCQTPTPDQNDGKSLQERKLSVATLTCWLSSSTAPLSSFKNPSRSPPWTEWSSWCDRELLASMSMALKATRALSRRDSIYNSRACE